LENLLAKNSNFASVLTTNKQKRNNMDDQETIKAIRGFVLRATRAEMAIRMALRSEDGTILLNKLDSSSREYVEDVLKDVEANQGGHKHE